MEPMPKDNSAMETPVTIPEAEAKADSVSAMETPVTITEGKADSASAMETPVTVIEGKADSASATDMTVTVKVSEGKAKSVSATDITVTVTEVEAKLEHPELLQTDGPFNGIDPSQPLFSQPEPKPITKRITVEERHLQQLNVEEVMPVMAEEPAEITPGLQAKQHAKCAEAKAVNDEAAKLEDIDCIPEMQENCHEHHAYAMLMFYAILSA